MSRLGKIGRESERDYISSHKWLEKALELIGALVHDKTFCLCVVGEEKSIYGQRGEDVFVSKNTTFNVEITPRLTFLWSDLQCFPPAIP